MLCRFLQVMRTFLRHVERRTIHYWQTFSRPKEQGARRAASMLQRRLAHIGMNIGGTSTILDISTEMRLSRVRKRSQTGTATSFELQLYNFSQTRRNTSSALSCRSSFFVRRTRSSCFIQTSAFGKTLKIPSAAQSSISIFNLHRRASGDSRGVVGSGGALDFPMRDLTLRITVASCGQNDDFDGETVTSTLLVPASVRAASANGVRPMTRQTSLQTCVLQKVAIPLAPKFPRPNFLPSAVTICGSV